MPLNNLVEIVNHTIEEIISDARNLPLTCNMDSCIYSDEGETIINHDGFSLQIFNNSDFNPPQFVIVLNNYEMDTDGNRFEKFQDSYTIKGRTYIALEIEDKAYLQDEYKNNIKQELVIVSWCSDLRNAEQLYQHTDINVRL